MKILLIDDEESILNLIRMNLILEGFEVEVSSNGYEGIEKFESFNPDLVILDIMLPDIDGFQVINKLRSINNEIPVILLTAKGQINDRLLGLQLGADDYITKPFDSRELILRIRAIYRRISKAKLNNDRKDNIDEIKKGYIRILKEKRKVFVDSEEIQVTYREFKTLLIMITNEGKVFTREELLEKIWGYDFHGNTRAVDMHIERIRKKLKKHRKIIKTVYGVGYKLEV
ncbi:response regulator transcription factor [Clostridium aestuarii]|uniref:Stage 0 sporulation protein A homolog n=1 Tax=Clostridium aestuarii TaxID=338193 RepID=A0ABT4D3M7_9CLOT|nr:response regulator transcription factor [Clostridium aestuarii]MCY6485831.1 response regulator transcription factor [Clostridium aestuarii]